MEIAETAAPPILEKVSKPRFEWSQITSSPAFIPGVLLFVGLIAMFWTLTSKLIPLWSADEYYSHGFLVPFISGYVVYRKWDKLKTIPVRPDWLGMIFLVPLLWVVYASHRMEINLILSLALIATLLAAAWVIAGWRWMFGLTAPILYLAFAMPLWSYLIDSYTMPLQQISTVVSFQLIKLFGIGAYMADSTMIMLDNYTLKVAVECSGLKLILALSAFAVFFMLVARLKFWANVAFAACVLPLALFINGLRIALIGLVGNFYGEEAASKFHDYSGYITLLICFFILFKGAKLLGWKD